MRQTSLDKYRLTTKDLAEKLGWNRNYIRRLAASGRLPAIKLLRKWQFCEEELLKFLKNEVERSNDDQPVKASDLLR